MRQGTSKAGLPGSVVVDRVRRALLASLTGALGLALASCATGNLTGGGDSPGVGSAQTFDAIGTGSVKVALLLPLSANGNAGTTAKALKEAAELALFEFNNPDIVLIPRDTQGTAAGAAAAAQAAIAEGAELIIGPLFAHSAAAVGPVARNANVPVIAFSTDSNVAGRGVYLLSFLPEDDITQVMRYAASKGKRSFAALLPENAYGTLAEGAVRQAAAQTQGRVIAVEKYPLDTQAMMEPAKNLAEVAKGPAPQADAVLIPDGPGVAPTLAPLLALNGVDLKKVKLLGSGQWNDPRMGKEPALQGGWFAAPDPAGWRSFVTRFQATYGAQPPRIATLSYDAVSLAAALARQPQGQRYTAENLTNSSGFSGVDGIFRFQPSGLNQRGLAILEVQAGGDARVIQAAPKSFAAQSF